jgi:hypothetical protein
MVIRTAFLHSSFLTQTKMMKSMSKLFRYLTLPAIVWGVASCTTAPSVSIKTDYDHSASFGKYHTYVLDTAATGLGPTNGAVLQQALRASLAARRLKETGANASLYIVSAVITSEKLNVVPGYGVTVARFGAYRTWAMNAEVQQYTEGTLVIDFVDGKTHKLVFRGLAQAAVGSQQARNANAIQEGVTKIVAQFPGPGAG